MFREQTPSRMITWIAVAQFVPLVLFPWTFSLSSLIFIVLLILLVTFLGWALWTHKWWGRTLTIFIQGFNIIVRIITFFGNVYSADRGLNWGLLVAYLCSVALSWLILSYIDKPEIQLLFES